MRLKNKVINNVTRESDIAGESYDSTGENTSVRLKSPELLLLSIRSKHTGPSAVWIDSGWVSGKPQAQHLPSWNRPTRPRKISGFLIAATTQPRARAKRESGLTLRPSFTCIDSANRVPANCEL